MFLCLFIYLFIYLFFGAHCLEDSGVLEDSDVPNSDVPLSFSSSVFFFQELLPGVKFRFQDGGWMITKWMKAIIFFPPFFFSKDLLPGVKTKNNRMIDGRWIITK